MPNSKFLASTVPEILGWSQNSKSGSRYPMTTFDLIMHLFRYNALPSVSLPNLKFLASIFSKILGGPKITKVGHVTQTWSFLT